MAKARAIIKRSRAVKNIRKITQTMQLIATARYQKCLQRATASQPYTDAITEMVETLSQLESADHPLLKPNSEAQQSVLLTMTSNRGLCGAYNASILRTSMEHRRQLLNDGLSPEMEMVGKKGINFARFLKLDLAKTITDVEDRIPYSRVAEMADEYIRRYEAGELNRVDIAYTRFISAGVQKPVVAQLLPMQPPEPTGDTEETADAARPDFDFSPEPAELLNRLIPETVRIRLYQYFNDAIVSEQVARMTAMKAATDAAGDMIRSLTQRYNRARQTQITMELLDIVGGAEAIS
jgi:F-type H+-transporting ATPase subunit gamma